MKVVDVEKHFKDNDGEMFKALNKVSLTLFENESISIVGESGCGKSTAARLICKLLPVDHGKLFFEGRDITDMKHRERKEYYKHVQMIFQEPYNTFSKRMKIKQYMIEPYINFRLMGRREAYSYCTSLLENVGLNDTFMDRYAGQLSGGELQRVTIARTMGLNPKMVVYDECTSALDVSIQKQVIDLILDLKKRNSFSSIFITHDLALAENISDRIYVMYFGKIVETLSGNDIVEKSRHPYSKALIRSVLSLSNYNEPVELKDLSKKNDYSGRGCMYAPICGYSTERCFHEEPVLSDEENPVACFNPVLG